MNYQNIEINVEEKIATVTINRPKVLNALSSEVIEELTEVFDDLSAVLMCTSSFLPVQERRPLSQARTLGR
ncbi:enoyl-CoA hydratase-related protein [Thalassobacillus sp. C254]|uniref:enoyl-CoA hydratase-related protein n=1 Tax=Thalassobacillus sp. C254 TaxID=1225341 RepID=UPI000B0A5467|nr:enoyl-CoA hydratase-related protein [Thalassobacillus sp. C254]